MFIDYKKYNLPIVSVDINDRSDTILFKTGLYTYKFLGYGDCCSFSEFKTFEDVPFSSVVGKIIKGVKELRLDDDFKCDDDDMGDTCASPHLFQMTFKDSDETFKFLMVNYSNGYYDGWMTSEIVL